MHSSLPQPEPIDAADEYYDLGFFGRRISTTSSQAQIWFNRGLTWAYAFNHEEAGRCFDQVIAHDATCPMGYWGVAFVSGPNYNKSWGAFDTEDLARSIRRCFNASRLAAEHVGNASPVEKVLVEALQHRYPVANPLDDFLEPNKNYADAMRKVYHDFGEDDLDVVTLAADAIMNTAPRKMFDAHTGKPVSNSPVFEVKAILERGLQKPAAKTHPGILHMYIHFMEMSETPEAALVAADHLRDLVPDAGHIAHMPTHIDVLVGDYRRSIASNMKATIADDKFYRKQGGENFYSFYRLHDYHSLIYAAMLSGQSQVALDATSRMEATITEDLLKIQSPPFADWMEFFLAVRVHVLIRFGMWDEIKALEVPKDKELYCVTIAMTHYGEAIAYSATNDIEKAEQERALYIAAASRVPESRMDFPNKMVDILKIASAMLDGELEYRRQNYEIAFEKLREAIHYDDSLHYTEPWGWMLPTRHPYAALSLEQGRVEQAAKAYAQDLGFDKQLTRAHQHPNNVWALHGYHECLLRLGKSSEADMIKGQLAIALAVADVPITSSCYCRLDTTESPQGKCCT